MVEHIGHRIVMWLIALALVLVNAEVTTHTSKTSQSAGPADEDARSVMATNYASSYLGAKIVEQHKDARGTSNLLKESKESYLNIPCRSEKKFFTLQLSKDIEVNLLAISNLEYFSSFVKNFTIIGSRTFPCLPPNCMWRVLGHFHAKPVRKVQLFPVKRSPSVRYLRFLWVSHHGNEKSCTLTSMQVYGTDVLENFAADLNSVGGGGESNAVGNRQDFESLPGYSRETGSQAIDLDIFSDRERFPSLGDSYLVPTHEFQEPSPAHDQPTRAPLPPVTVKPIFVSINLTEILHKIDAMKTQQAIPPRADPSPVTETIPDHLNGTMNTTSTNNSDIPTEAVQTNESLVPQIAANQSKVITIFDFLPPNATLKCRKSAKTRHVRPNEVQSKGTPTDTCSYDDKDYALAKLNGTTPIEWGYILPVPLQKLVAQQAPTQPTQRSTNNPIIRLFHEVKVLQQQLAAVEKQNLALRAQNSEMANNISIASMSWQWALSELEGKTQHDLQNADFKYDIKLKTLRQEESDRLNTVYWLLAFTTLLSLASLLGMAMRVEYEPSTDYDTRRHVPAHSPSAARSPYQSPQSDSLFTPTRNATSPIDEVELHSSGMFERESDVDDCDRTHAPRRSTSSDTFSEDGHRMLGDMTDDTRASARDLSDVLGTDISQL